MLGCLGGKGNKPCPWPGRTAVDAEMVDDSPEGLAMDTNGLTSVCQLLRMMKMVDDRCGVDANNEHAHCMQATGDPELSGGGKTSFSQSTHSVNNKSSRVQSVHPSNPDSLLRRLARPLRHMHQPDRYHLSTQAHASLGIMTTGLRHACSRPSQGQASDWKTNTTAYCL